MVKIVPLVLELESLQRDWQTKYSVQQIYKPALIFTTYVIHLFCGLTLLVSSPEFRLLRSGQFGVVGQPALVSWVSMSVFRVEMLELKILAFTFTSSKVVFKVVKAEAIWVTPIKGHISIIRWNLIVCKYVWPHKICFTQKETEKTKLLIAW